MSANDEFENLPDVDDNYFCDNGERLEMFQELYEVYRENAMHPGVSIGDASATFLPLPNDLMFIKVCSDGIEAEYEDEDGDLEYRKVVCFLAEEDAARRVLSETIDEYEEEYGAFYYSDATMCRAYIAAAEKLCAATEFLHEVKVDK